MRRIWWVIGNELYYGDRSEAHDVVEFHKEHLDEILKKRPIAAEHYRVREYISYLKKGHDSCRFRLTHRELESIGEAVPESLDIEEAPEPPPMQKRKRRRR